MTLSEFLIMKLLSARKSYVFLLLLSVIAPIARSSPTLELESSTPTVLKAEDLLPPPLEEGPVRDICLLFRREEINEIWAEPKGRKERLLERITEQWLDEKVHKYLHIYKTHQAYPDLVIDSRGLSGSIIEFDVYVKGRGIKQYCEKLTHKFSKFEQPGVDKLWYRSLNGYVIGIALGADIVRGVRRLHKQPRMDGYDALDEFELSMPAFNHIRIWPRPEKWPTPSTEDNMGYMVSWKEWTSPPA